MSVLSSEANAMSERLSVQTGHVVETAIGQRWSVSWVRLLWLQMRQLWPWLLMGSLLTVAIQILQFQIGLVQGQMNSSEYQALRSQVHIWAWLGPVVFLIGALGASFSAWDQPSGWHWTASLPVRWQQHLLVKWSLAWLGGAIVLAIGLVAATLVCQLIPPPVDVEVWKSNLERWQDQLAQSMWNWTVVITVCLTVAWPIGVISVLCFRQPTTGMTVGVIGSTLYLWLMAWLHWPSLNVPSWLTPAGKPILDSGWQLSHWLPWAIHALVLSAVAVGLYRWRWTSGMFCEWSLPGRGLALPTFGTREANSRFGRGGAWRSLWWLAISRTLWLWLVFVVMLLPLGLSSAPFAVMLSLLGLGAWLCWMGILAFSGERSPEAGWMLAERGVSPAAVWWSRYTVHVLLPILALGAVQVVTVWWSQRSGLRAGMAVGEWWEAAIVLLAIAASLHNIAVVGLVAGLAIRSWLLAACFAGLAVILVSPLLTLHVMASGGVGLFAFLALPLLGLPISYWLVRVHLFRYRPDIGWVFFLYTGLVVTFSLISLPILRVWSLPAPSRHLAQPTPFPEVRVPERQAFPVDFGLESRSAAVVALMGESPAEPVRNRFLLQLRRDRHHEFLAQVGQNRVQPESETWQYLQNFFANNVQHQLAELDDAWSAPLPLADVSVPLRSELLRTEAWLSDVALVALALGEAEEAIRALRIRARIWNEARSLLEYGGGVQPAYFLRELASMDEALLAGIGQAVDKGEELLPTVLHPRVDPAFEQAIVARLSYAYRHPPAVWGAEGRDRPANKSIEISSDRLLDQLEWTSRSRVSWDDALMFRLYGMESWMAWFEAERGRREVSVVYRRWRQGETGETGDHPRPDWWRGLWFAELQVLELTQRRLEEVAATQKLSNRLRLLVP